MIGVFDSGVGGLSILREIRAVLPTERLVYVADTAHLPYGTKPPEFVEARALSVSEFLVQRGARAIVIACNTATAASVAAVRAHFPVPVVGVEPAVKPATRATLSGVIGVLATPGTLGSGKFARLIEAHADVAEVLLRPCPGWVEQVERGELGGLRTRQLVAREVEPLLAAGADTLVLGCTHFPFLRPVVQSVSRPGTQVLDTGAAVARELYRRLAETNTRGGPTTSAAEAREELWTSGMPRTTAALIGRLWGRELPVRALPAGFAGLASVSCR